MHFNTYFFVWYKPTSIIFHFSCLFVCLTCILGQSITVDPAPSNPSVPSPTPSNPYSNLLNCSQYTSCGTCNQQSACGWCAADGGQCIRAFNFLTVQGTSLDTCYGIIDQYFWLQCNMGAKTLASLGIAGSIVIGLVLLTMCACFLRAHRRRSQHTNLDRLSVRLTKKYTSKQKPTTQSKALKTSPQATASLESPESPKSTKRFSWKK